MHIDFQNDLDLTIKRIQGNTTQTISALVYDSRKVIRDAVFFCTTGTKVDGHHFIEDAIHKGASVIVGTNEETFIKLSDKYKAITFITVPDTKSAMAKISRLFYKDCYRNLTTFAVTGTNGKTTTTSYIRSLLNQLNKPTGSIGTLGIMNHKEEINLHHSTHTTPEVNDLHQALDEFHTQDLQAAAIEVTSIAIEQQRIEEMTFNVGIHTNLTPEHLDFHSDFNAYKEAKLKMFQQVETAVVNLDDDGMAQEILDTFPGSILTYGLDRKAHVSAWHRETSVDGTTFELHVNNQIYPVQTPVIGSYNISNLLAAICACQYLEIPITDFIWAVQHLENPNGRFQLLNEHNRNIILDYAHTPNGLGNVLEAVHKLPHQRMILMITGVGLSDPKQRPDLARAVENQADEIIVSVDHPGFYDRQDIIDDVMKGFINSNAAHIHTVLNREDAIHKALTLANPEDIVLLTGLGYGGYQVIDDQNVPYSDRESIHNFFDSELQFLQACVD